MLSTDSAGICGVSNLVRVHTTSRLRSNSAGSENAILTYGSVAQWLEQSPLKRWVVGSNPTGPTKRFDHRLSYCTCEKQPTLARVTAADVTELK